MQYIFDHEGVEHTGETPSSILACFQVLSARQVPRVKIQFGQTIEAKKKTQEAERAERRKGVSKSTNVKSQILGGDPFWSGPCHGMLLLTTVLRYERENEKTKNERGKSRGQEDQALRYINIVGLRKVANGGEVGGVSGGEVKRKRN
jgi:hypothetical protein